MTDPYDFWRRRLAGEVVPDDEPQAGFYRICSNKLWLPVAIWFEDGELRCDVGQRSLPSEWVKLQWPSISKNPISDAVYDAVIKGDPWPEAAARDRANSDAAPDADSYDSLKDRIEDLAREAQKLVQAGAAKTQQEADGASDLANRLADLWNRADWVRKGEKQPLDKQVQAVQAKWAPLLTAAEIYKRIKAAVITPFLVEEDKKRYAAQAEAARTGAVPTPTPKLKAGSDGGRRSVALRTEKEAQIEDYKAVLAWCAEHEEVKAVVQKIATKAVRAGHVVPGVKIIETKSAA